MTAADTCGAIGEPCCAGTNACQAGLTCTGGACVGCVAALALGDAHGCALLANGGTVACWGKNDHGQLGFAGGDAAAAVAVVDDHGQPIAGITAIAAGGNHSCALKSDKTVLCWGDDAPVPALVALTTIDAIAAGAHHSCASLDSGAVWCWGANDSGQLGAAPSAGSPSPMEVVDGAGGPLVAAAVTAGATHSCAVGRDHKLVCWGSDIDGELGDGTTAATRLPTPAGSLGAHVVGAAAGTHFGCALGDDGRVSCFGANDQGQSGQPASAAVAVPTPLAIDLATAVAAGASQACARRAGGAMICWGAGAAPSTVRDSVGPIAVGGSDACSARVNGVDCATFGDPHIACN